MSEEEAEEAEAALECGVCLEPYDRGGRAPRRLGAALAGASGRCRHALCTACARRLARGGRLTCPFCRAVTPLRRSRGRGRRFCRRFCRLRPRPEPPPPLPPVDADLWQRLAARPPPQREAPADVTAPAGQSPWRRALARLLIGRRARPPANGA